MMDIFNELLDELLDELKLLLDDTELLELLVVLETIELLAVLLLVLVPGALEQAIIAVKETAPIDAITNFKTTFMKTSNYYFNFKV